MAAGARASSVTGNAPCRIESTTYKGWQAQQISNNWVKLIIVPKNGRRLNAGDLWGACLSLCQSQVRGQYLPPTERKWFN